MEVKNKLRFKNKINNGITPEQMQAFDENLEKYKAVTKTIGIFRKISGNDITNDEILQFYSLVLLKNRLAYLLGKKPILSSVKILEAKMIQRNIRYVKK